MMRRFFRATAGLVGLSVLAGCASNPFVVEVTDCPAVAFVRYANTVTRFAPTSEYRPQDVAYSAAFADLSVDCQDLGEGVTTAISFTVNAAKGPAATADAITLPYFVTVLRDGERIVGKRVFTSTITFPPGQTRAAVREVISQKIPTDSAADEYAHEVLIGFQLSEDEAAYNVRR
ncbi:MAG: hypothetical protein ACOY99_01595 [Pseudomonadota bacterium]